MRSKFIAALALLLTLIFIGGCNSSPMQQPKIHHQESGGKNTWKQISDGISYKEFHLSSDREQKSKDFLLAVIDPKKFTFEIYQNESAEKAKTIKEIQKETGAQLTFNGGFFTKEFEPTGLLISNGQKLRKVSNAKLLEGIFAIQKNGQAKLLDQQVEMKDNEYLFAIQNGPIILDSKGTIAIDHETNEVASRTAIGLDKNQNIVVIILKQSLLNSDNKISLYEFAHLLKKTPELKDMELHSVVNLDGGPSTGIMIGESYYPEMERVQNVVIVKKQ